jgi:hypothetical protein
MAVGAASVCLTGPAAAGGLPPATVLWHRELRAVEVGGPIVGDGVVALTVRRVTGNAVQVRAASTGRVIWERALPAPADAVAVGSSRVFVAHASGGGSALLALDKATGVVRTRRVLATNWVRVYQLATGDGRLYADGDARVGAFTPQLQPIWSRSAPVSLLGAPGDGFVYVRSWSAPGACTSRYAGATGALSAGPCIASDGWVPYDLGIDPVAGRIATLEYGDHQLGVTALRTTNLRLAWQRRPLGDAHDHVPFLDVDPTRGRLVLVYDDDSLAMHVRWLDTATGSDRCDVVDDSGMPFGAVVEPTSGRVFVSYEYLDSGPGVRVFDGTCRAVAEFHAAIVAGDLRIDAGTGKVILLIAEYDFDQGRLTGRFTLDALR